MINKLPREPRFPWIRYTLVALVFAAAACFNALGQEAKQPAAGYPFVFKDAGDEAGLFPHVAGIRGHGVAWGDVEAITRRVQEHLDAGADHVCVQPVPRRPGDLGLDQLRELAPALPS